MTPGGPSALDARVAELLVARGLLTPDKVAALRARAAGRVPGPSGSALLDVAVELNVVPRAAAIALLGQARALFAASGPPAGGSAPGAGSAPPPSFSRLPSVSTSGERPAPAPTPAPADSTQWSRSGPSSFAAPPPAAAPAPRIDESDRTSWNDGSGGGTLGGGARGGARPAADSQRTNWVPDAPSPKSADTEDRTRWTAGDGDADDRTLQAQTGAGGGVTWNESPQAAMAAAAAAAMGGGPAASSAPEPPEVRYEVLEELGPGRSRVMDSRLQRHLLLLVAGKGEERRLARHARILAQLDHPAIQRVHDALRWGTQPAFTTDEVEGEAFGPAAGLGESALLRAFLDVAAAIAHAHERGLVHGTLGPARVILGTYGRAWVTGWDTARSLPGATPQVVRAASEAEAAPIAGDVPRAPEVAEGEPPGVAADVWGLGRVLEQAVTAAGKGASPALRAIARKASSRKPDARYDSASDLAEDVRRYLDGRSVGALRETTWQALRRLSKHHPAAAAIAGLAVAVVLGGGLVTVAVTQRQYAQASAQAEATSAQRERAAALLTEARGARDASVARQAVAQDRVELERTLRAPAQGVDDPDQARRAQLERAGDLLKKLDQAAKGAGAALDTTFVAARVHAAAAEHHLRGAARPDPARALEEYRALAALLERRLRRDPLAEGAGPSGPFDEVALARVQLADAQVGRFLSARRLPGAAARAEEDAALDAMSSLEETRELARLERAVRAVEVEAARLVAKQPLPEAVKDEPELLAAAQALVKARPDLAFAHELVGRVRVALSVPGRHRSQRTRFPDGREGSAEERSYYYGAFGAFFRASYLDPTETEPRVSYLEVWNAKYALHFPWRWIGGWAIDNALRAARTTPRPDAMLRVTRMLGSLERTVAIGPLLEPWLDPSIDLSPELRAAVELAHARGLLAGGGRVAPERLQALEIPPELAADKRFVVGWALLVGGDLRRGFEEVMGGLQTAPGPTLGLHDFEDALCDPRVDPRGLVALLDQAIPPPQAGSDGSPVVHALLLARALARGRAGQPDVSGDLPRLQQISQAVRQPTRAAARFMLANAMSFANAQPQHPGGHLNALILWGQVNLDVGSTEREVLLARDLIVNRLERLGASDAARAFKEVDPVEEVYVRRAWVPEEAHVWRLPEGGRR